MSLESQIAELVTSTNELTQLVMDLLNGNGADVKKIVYASPLGTGSGATVDTPTNLAAAIAALKPGTINEIRLLAGEHVLPSQTQIKDVFGVMFTAWEYNANNPPIIVSPHTTAAYVIEACGVPAPGAAAGAHSHTEWPLDIVSTSLVVFQNIWIRGTVHALTVDSVSHLRFVGDCRLAHWIPSVGRTGYGLVLVNSRGYCADGNSLQINTYHPNYSEVGDPLSFVSPLKLDMSNMLVVGILRTYHNYRLTEAQGVNTAVVARKRASLYVKSLTTRCAGRQFYIDNADVSVDYWEFTTDSTPLWQLAYGENGPMFRLGDGTTTWPALNSTTKVQAEPTSGAAIIMRHAGEVNIRPGVKVLGVNAAAAFLSATGTMTVNVNGIEVGAGARAGNSGFTHGFKVTTSGDASLVDVTVTLRDTDTDVFADAQTGGQIVLTGTNTLTVSDEYNVTTGGVYIDAAGVVHTS